MARHEIWRIYIAVTDSAINAGSVGRAAHASFTTKPCSFNELMISHAGVQALALQHPGRESFHKLRTIYGRATVVTTKIDGVELRVRIAAKNVMTSYASTFYNAAIACFKLVCGVDVTGYDSIDAMGKCLRSAGRRIFSVLYIIFDDGIIVIIGAMAKPNDKAMQMPLYYSNLSYMHFQPMYSTIIFLEFFFARQDKVFSTLLRV